ncbi:MAG TPA: GntR family transcriptional regulator [Planctomicrobium sp.]|nr:GntR family transcriptional regulator [Planctomicrobium sp.]
MPDSTTDDSRSSARRSTPSSILQLASRIEDDIEARRLQPGDPYLSTAETAKMLRVGTATANRALQLLEQRQVLTRRQRRGTFISASAADAKTFSRRVNVIVDQSYLKTEGILADGVMVGIQSRLPQAELRFRFMPAVDDPEFVHRMIDEALRSSQREGFVLVRSSLTVQRLVADSGLPAVIFGTPYPSINTIPSIDRNSAQIGKLLVEYLLAQGCRQFLVLLRQQVMPGDHRLLDAVHYCLIEAGHRESLLFRCFPAERGVIEHDVAHLLSSARHKVGILCRSEPLAEGAEAALSLIRQKRKDFKAEIVVTDIYRSSPKDPTLWPYAETELSPQEIGTRIGELLADQFAQRPSMDDHVVIPVRLKTTK